MKKTVARATGLLMSAGLGYILPIAILWIYMDITGYSKGWGYDLRDEASVSVMLGVIELIIALPICLAIIAHISVSMYSERKPLAAMPFIFLICGAALFFLLTPGISFTEWITEFIPPWKR